MAHRLKHSSPGPPRAGTRVDPSAVEAEYRVLTTDEGRRLLDEVAALGTIHPAGLDRLRKLAPPATVAAALRLVEARRKGAAKFDRAGSMWLDPVGVEQATAGPVARHKAARFEGSPAVVDLCAGVGGDAIALADRAPVIAVDLDPGNGRRLRWNAGVYGVADRIVSVRARAEDFAFPEGVRIHIDPDRRADRDRRARALEDYAPGPAFWSSMMESVPGGAIKLSPAADFARVAPIGSGREVELVSLNGECKEATVWFGNLATCRRRATVLPSGATWTDGDGEARLVPIAAPVGWIFDPDPAILRAGLLDRFAGAHGLARAADGIDYLTAPEKVESPFLSAFAVIERTSLDPKRMKEMLRRHGIGRLEIKVRGIDLAPETLRARLDLKGDESATLLIVGRSCAVLAHRAG